jgi:hypothetical protein
MSYAVTHCPPIRGKASLPGCQSMARNNYNIQKKLFTFFRRNRFNLWPLAFYPIDENSLVRLKNFSLKMRFPGFYWETAKILGYWRPVAFSLRLINWPDD